MPESGARHQPTRYCRARLRGGGRMRPHVQARCGGPLPPSPPERGPPTCPPTALPALAPPLFPSQAHLHDRCGGRGRRHLGHHRVEGRRTVPPQPGARGAAHPSKIGRRGQRVLPFMVRVAWPVPAFSWNVWNRLLPCYGDHARPRGWRRMAGQTRGAVAKQSRSCACPYCCAAAAAEPRPTPSNPKHAHAQQVLPRAHTRPLCPARRDKVVLEHVFSSTAVLSYFLCWMLAYNLGHVF
jgi:hypothetical protein